MELFKRHNPFVTGPIIPDKYFCGRKKETERIISLLESGNNVVLAAPRRVGKTTLLRHILEQNAVRKKYNTFFVDLYDAASPEMFYEKFKQALFDSDIPKSDRLKIDEITREYESALNLNVKILSIETSRRIQKKILVENTLSELFDVLSTTKKPNIVVFDEFQQIEEFKDKITRFLRTKIQALPNTRFVYSGSETHMLYSMFNNYNEPFYKSSMTFGLKRIDVHTYTQFCRDKFKDYGKNILPEAVELVYDLFWGNFLNLQQVFNKVFDYTPKGGNADIDSVKASIRLILEDRDELYRGVFQKYPNGKERALLICVAQEGIASALTSASMIRTYSLGSASSVQNAIKNLTAPQNAFITRLTGTAYCLSDKFLELWIASNRSLLDLKYATAKSLAQKEQALWNVDLSINKDKTTESDSKALSTLPAEIPLTQGQEKEISEVGYIKGPVVFGDKAYVVQRNGNGRVISLPQDEILPVLLSDIQEISHTVGRNVTSDDVEMLSYGQTIGHKGKTFRFDIESSRVVECVTGV